MNEPLKMAPSEQEATELKTCCAALYQSDVARLLLGTTFHPGGETLTLRLGELLQLGSTSVVLDVASGQGTSALRLAQHFGCQVLGIDYGEDAVQQANAQARELHLSHLVTFQQGDAENLPVPSATFDAVLCECAFCTFPDKVTAAAEWTRVLKPGGRVGLSDLTRVGEVVEDLQGLLAWVACIADAQPVERYQQYLTSAGLTIESIEPHNEALSEMVREIQGKLLGAELLLALKKIELPLTINFAQAKALVRAASAAIRAGQFGYVVLSAMRPVS
ncbi:MAG: class I SAM-dependent methyltransferase [Ktedonobacteraceae bacterium]